MKTLHPDGLRVLGTVRDTDKLDVEHTFSVAQAPTCCHLQWVADGVYASGDQDAALVALVESSTARAEAHLDGIMFGTWSCGRCRKTFQLAWTATAYEVEPTGREVVTEPDEEEPTGHADGRP